MAPRDRRAASHLDADNPWPGLEAYNEDAEPFFHGRDEDKAQLLRLIRNAGFVTLYGKSGLGKSSLLQAGVFPALRAARFLPVYLRPDFSETADQPPLQQALARLRAETQASGHDAPAPEPGEGLWAYLQRRERPIWTADNFPVTPVLVFDQFEEVFSRGGSPEHIRQMLADMADLVGDRPGSELATDREAAKRLNLQAQQYRVVLSFRSDFLADVLSWSAAAGLPQHESLHLLAMSRETAIEAVEQAGAAVIEPGVAAQIVDFVLGRDAQPQRGRATDVEPVLLSLCCFQLNSRRVRPARIDARLLQSVGQDILLDFYREALAGTEPRVSIFIEDNLIQGGRYRSSFPREAALASGALTAGELELLQKRRLLRLDVQEGVPRIELIHDRLVGIVRAARDARLAREEERAEREAAAELEQAERERLRAFEIAESRDRLRLLLGALVVLSCFLVGAGVAASRQRDEALANARHAEALRLGLEAQGMLNGTVAGGDWRAFQELLASHSLWPGSQTDSALFSALVARQHLRALLPVHWQVDSAVGALAFVPAGTGWWMAAGHADGGLTLHDLAHPQQELARAVGHQDMVHAIAVSPDGQRVVTAGEDGRLQRWRLHPLDPQKLSREGPPLIEKRDAPINSAAFSPDGRRIVSGGQDGFVRLWDAESGALLKARAPVPGIAVASVGFRPDGRHPAIGAVGAADPRKRVANLWLLDAETLEPQDREPRYAHSQNALALAFSPAGDRVATGGQDNMVRLHDLADEAHRSGPATIVRLDGGSDIEALAFSPNGRWLAAGNERGELRLWAASSTGEPVGLPLPGSSNPITSVAFSPDGLWLAGAGEDGGVWLWPIDRAWAADTALTAVTAVPTASASPAAASSPSSSASSRSTMASASTRPSGSGPVLASAAAAGPASSVAIGLDGTLLVFGLGDGGLLVREGSRSDRRIGPDDSEASAADGPAGPAPCAAAKEAPERSAAGWRSRQDAAELPQRVTALALAADGRTVVSAHADGKLRRWDLGTDTLLGTPIQASRCGLLTIALSQDGQRIAATSRDGSLLVLDARTQAVLPYASAARAAGDPLGVAVGEGSKPSALAFSNDGQVLAVASRAGSILLYGSDSRPPATIAGGIEALSSLAFSPDDTVIVSGSEKGKVRLWDVARRQPMGPAEPAGSDDVRAVAFAADGQQFFSSGLRGRMRSWPAPVTWPARMCDKLSSNLSRSDWAAWVSADVPYRCPCPGLPIEADASPTPQPAPSSSPAQAEVCRANP